MPRSPRTEDPHALYRYGSLDFIPKTNNYVS
jgi:hypothetical protein